MLPFDKPRLQALEILRAVEEGVFADTLIDQARQSFDERDSAFILELVYGTLRNRALIDWMLDQFSIRPVVKTDAWTRNILRLGAYQMLFLDRVPESAAVNTAAELAKTHGGKCRYVNGLLRTLDRKRNEIARPDQEDPIRRLSILHSHPPWLVRRWVTRFGPERAEKLLQENNRPAPLTIRTNTLKTSREELKAALESGGATVQDIYYAPAGIEIRSSPGISLLAAYQSGLFIVQDEAAQLVSMVLSPQPEETVLDACAAPGGKATHLAELMKNQGLLVALESDPKRMEVIKENSERLGINIIKPAIGDAASYQEGSFNKILIDAPCSGLGVLRRHPDGRWTKREKGILEKQALQKRILENCSRLLKSGGVLVYATCTTEPEENEEVIASFLSGEGKQFRIDDPRPHLPASAAKLVDGRGFFHTYPVEPEMDGFFCARLVKKS
jgi:16S rRNA (cytosine967-C5)-methyltransferase